MQRYRIGVVCTVVGVGAVLITGSLTLKLSLSAATPLQELPPGLWRVAEAQPAQGLLTRQAEFTLGADRARAAITLNRPETLVVMSGEVLSEPRFASTRTLHLTAENSTDASATTIQLYSAALNNRSIVFSAAGTGPTLQRRPLENRNYAFSAKNTLWLYSLMEGEREYASDHVGEFKRAELAAQIESTAAEGYHLIWAADPLWSSDGRLIAYATNREAVRQGGVPNGQSVWIKDVITGRERVLLRGDSVGYAPFGWLGEEFVYTRTDVPGVYAVNPRTAEVRLIAPRGEPLAIAPRGLVLVYRERDSVRVLTAEGLFTPAPPSGTFFSAFAAFSPGGGSVALLAMDPRGRRILCVLELGSRSLAVFPLRVEPGVAGLLDPPAWVDDQTLLINMVLHPSGEPRSQILRVR